MHNVRFIFVKFNLLNVTIWTFIISIDNVLIYVLPLINIFVIIMFPDRHLNIFR